MSLAEPLWAGQGGSQSGGGSLGRQTYWRKAESKPQTRIDAHWARRPGGGERLRPILRPWWPLLPLPLPPPQGHRQISGGQARAKARVSRIWRIDCGLNISLQADASLCLLAHLAAWPGERSARPRVCVSAELVAPQSAPRPSSQTAPLGLNSDLGGRVLGPLSRKSSFTGQ